MNKNLPSVTILISAKNAKNTIEKCVNSLFRQTYRNKKIYIIDNASTDETYEILKKFGKKIKLERIPGRVPKVLNHAIKKINTEFIAFTDADCVVDKNWLKNLISGFTSEEILATAGYCGTPNSVNKLQKLIGRELESRWKKFPEYISRSPTMNMCVRTKIAKKIKFNEKYFWAWDTDFGYRLNEIGKMKYVTDAIIYHYHRATWRSFFRQQMNNAKIQSRLSLMEHRSKIIGDNISTFGMMLTLLLFGAFLAFSAGFLTMNLTGLHISFAIAYNFMFLVSLWFLIAYFIIILIFSIKLSKTPSDFFWFVAIFLVRTIAWIIGLIVGFIEVIK